MKVVKVKGGWVVMFGNAVLTEPMSRRAANFLKNEFLDADLAEAA